MTLHVHTHKINVASMREVVNDWYNGDSVHRKKLEMTGDGEKNIMRQILHFNSARHLNTFTQ